MAARTQARPPRIPRDPRLRRVLLAFALGMLTEFATWLAILLVAFDEGGAAAAGAASLAMLVPAIVLVPLVAGVGDRIPRGRALSLTYTAVALAAVLTGALILLDAPLAVILLGGVLLTIGVGLVRPMHFAAVPLIARRPGDLVAANALSTVLDGAALFLGFALAGAVSDAAGAWAVMALCALLSLVAALATRGLGLPVALVEDGDGAEEVRAALAGLVSLRRSAGALVLLALVALVSVLEGANDTMTLAFGSEVLGAAGATLGVLTGATGLGMAIGAAGLVGVAHHARLAPVVAAAALVIGLGQAAVALLGSAGAVVAVLLVVGMAESIVVVAARTLLQRTTEDAVLARVMAIQEGVNLGGLALGAVVGPALVLTLGPRAAFIPLGLGFAALGLLALPFLTRMERSAAVHTRELGLLRRVPFLAALPPFALERLAQAATWTRAPAGTRVITQGEPGDAFYLAASGSLVVEVDGVPRPGTLGPGDGFGEIALLRRSPRTATVIACADVDLLVLDAASFLAAVTSSVTGQELAERTANDRLAGGGVDA